MAEPDFYKILGVPPSATPEAVKAAYRELVKKYHPDLHHSAAKKAQANDKLQQINEAYAVLGDVERRREYDERRLQKTRAVETVAPASPSRRARRTQRAEAPRESRRKPVVWRKLAAPILAAAAVALTVYALWEEPQPKTAWILFEKTAFEPAQRVSRPESAAADWSPASRYASSSECADGLKQMVLRDEREGSKAVVDERGGTMAITVQIRDEAALARQYLEAKLRRASPDSAKGGLIDRELLHQQASEEAREFIRRNGIAKRVRNYECRQIRVPRSESWLRRQLRRAVRIF